MHERSDCHGAPERGQPQQVRALEPDGPGDVSLERAPVRQPGGRLQRPGQRRAGIRALLLGQLPEEDPGACLDFSGLGQTLTI